jgi:hypothetical protein
MPFLIDRPEKIQRQMCGKRERRAAQRRILSWAQSSGSNNLARGIVNRTGPWVTLLTLIVVRLGHSRLRSLKSAALRP